MLIKMLKFELLGVVLAENILAFLNCKKN